jgi:hypothetical protein
LNISVHAAEKLSLEAMGLFVEASSSLVRMLVVKWKTPAGCRAFRCWSFLTANTNMAGSNH